MFQSFEVVTSPGTGPARLKALRAELRAAGLNGFAVPRADVHQGEYVAARDARLEWLTGFTGSAGFCVVLADEAGVFIDGRYRVQVQSQIAKVFTPVHWPETSLLKWVGARLDGAARIGFDPWLHTAAEVSAWDAGEVAFVPTDNLVDRIWADQPTAPQGRVEIYPDALAGRAAAEKCADLAETLRDAGQRAAVLTLPDSICWLLNIRGSDIPRNPVVQCFAILRDSGTVDLFIAPTKVEGVELGAHVTCHAPERFAPALAALEGPVRADRGSLPFAVAEILREAGVELAYDGDPCILAKACKNAAEIDGTRAAHVRDGAAMCEFLHWLSKAEARVLAGERVSEINVANALEAFRRETNQLRDISFETIAGAGPNGAIVHYRVNEETNRDLEPGTLLLVDSGGQYLDGTTDITRTMAIGAVGVEEKQCFTRVLQGMIAVSRARWPRGCTGRDLDALARYPQWLAGMDYDHGTGHGVGVYLSVHEGPQRISRASDVTLAPGMILSNEPGYYREAAFGIRIENLVVVREAPPLGDNRDQLCFETLTWVPIERRLIALDLLSTDERAWIDAYHQEVAARIGPFISGDVAAWLTEATAPL